MKSKNFWGILSILILLLSTAFTSIDQNAALTPIQNKPMAEGASLATISPVQGEIYWRQESQLDWFSIDIEQGLDSGNQVLTKAEGRAMIEYYDGIIVRVGPHTLFTVNEQAQTPDMNLISRIRLMMGQIFIKHGEGYYDGKFEVETPSGVAAVKGTMMSVQITPDGQTLITCLEGVCALSNDLGQLTLTQGQGASIESEGEAPQPAEIEDWQLNDWFENDPETVNIALQQGLIDHMPAECNTATGENCVPKLNCNTLTGGEGCLHPGGCDPISGKGCITGNIINPEDFINCFLNGTCNEDGWTIPAPGTVILPDTDDTGDIGDNLPGTIIEVLPSLPEDNTLPDVSLPDVSLPEVTLPENPCNGSGGGFLETLLDGLQNLIHLNELKHLNP